MTGETLGQRLRRLRWENGLTQRELAARAGITDVTIYFAETGRASPKKRTIAQLAEVLGVSMPYLEYGVIEDTGAADDASVRAALLRTTSLSESRIDQVVRVIEAFEAEQALLRLRHGEADDEGRSRPAPRDIQDD